MKKKKTRQSTLFKLTFRTVLFLFLLFLVLFVFYLSGNIQDFLDTTQKFILQLIEINLTFLAIFSFMGIFLSIHSIIRSGRKRRILYTVFFLFLTIFSPVIYIVIRFLMFSVHGLS